LNKCPNFATAFLNYQESVKAKHARVAELVDALDSKSCAFGRAGSIPAPGTIAEKLSFGAAFPFLRLSNALLFLVNTLTTSLTEVVRHTSFPMMISS
jgi:hypothetical protein